MYLLCYIINENKMKNPKWLACHDLISLFQRIGRASLLLDLQDSHSGNMAVLWTDEKGEKKIVITSTGSQKGELEPEHICFISHDKTDFGYYKASSESDIHAGILALDGVHASMHCHTKNLNIVTLDDKDKPNQPDPFVPVDPLGFYYCKESIPIDWVKVPSGSQEMAAIIPKRLSQHPVTAIQTHGAFMRGRTLQETFFLGSIAENSAYIVRLMGKLNININILRKKALKDHISIFQYKPPEYTVNDDDVCDFPQEKELVKEFYKAGARIFESRISPFHTGSISIRGVNTILYAPKAAMPREIGGPLLEISLKEDTSDNPEIRMHKIIYSNSDFQSVMHCYVPEAEAHARYIYPGESEPRDRIIAIDAEGSFLYPAIPVVSHDVDEETLLHLLHDYKVVVVRGGGVWSVGGQSISEVLHHPSSVREICYIRIGAIEQGLDLGKMEPEKAKRW
jgi:ribulose-5-phosphate 4-epimerase/fuculose-1-phosphate aldolase